MRAGGAAGEGLQGGGGGSGSGGRAVAAGPHPASPHRSPPQPRPCTSGPRAGPAPAPAWRPAPGAGPHSCERRSGAGPWRPGERSRPCRACHRAVRGTGAALPAGLGTGCAPRLPPALLTNTGCYPGQCGAFRRPDCSQHPASLSMKSVLRQPICSVLHPCHRSQMVAAFPIQSPTTSQPRRRPQPNPARPLQALCGCGRALIAWQEESRCSVAGCRPPGAAAVPPAAAPGWLAAI